ncbi:hypothetical protein KSS87_005040 [Heliosperma pusillum]|nr:hypothetical protein KSS87_005040 [Heliosperma pusillum]
MEEKTEMISLPIIDLTAVDRCFTAASIRQACIETGFFYIVNHGVEKHLLEGLFDESRKLFELPEEYKMKLSRKEYRGYSAMYAEKLDPTSDTKGDPKETFYVGPIDGENCNLNQWPSAELLPTWRSTIETYHQKLLSAAKSILTLLALALNLEDETFFIRAKDSPVPFLRLLHYPGSVCREKDCHPRVWEDVHHIEGAFIVNIGDLMERWTNGLFRSTLHRVNPRGKERYSAAFFCDPHANVVVECLESCCDESNPPRFRPIRAGDYFRERFRLTYGD